MKAKIESSFLIEYDVYRGAELLESRSKKRKMLPKQFELGNDIKTGLKKIVKLMSRKLAATVSGYSVGVVIPIDFKYEESYCNDSICVAHIVGTPFDYSVLELFVTGVTYRTLRMAARGKAHIYGLSDAEYYKRMSERREHYDKKQSDELLKLFKEGLVKTKAKI